MSHGYFTFMIANKEQTLLYVGVKNSLLVRRVHQQDPSASLGMTSGTER